MISSLLRKVSLLFKNTLYYPGCLTSFVLPEIKENYINILKWLEQEHIVIKERMCCGSPVRAAGYLEDFAALVDKHKKLLNDYGVGRIIVNCPACFVMFKRFYPDFEVLHFVDLLAQEHVLRKLRAFACEGVITYHDPCHLARYAGKYEEPRAVLRALGFKLVEMEHNRKRTMCCGAGGGLRNNYPDIARAVGKRRIKEALSTGADALITTCPMCYLHLKECARGKIKVMEFSEVVTNAVKGKTLH